MNKEIAEYLEQIKLALEEKKHTHNAIQQAKYMKNKFEYFGLTSPLRRAVLRPFLLKENLPIRSNLSLIVKELWDLPQREYQYFAQELCMKYFKSTEEKDMALFIYMATHKSWWDTIDVIAPKLMGNYFLVYPELRKSHLDKWLNSDNMWLVRCAILFQLKYKKEVDLDLLEYTISKAIGTKEFFINKAIGWVLREYSRVHPEWVKEICAKYPLSNLSRREALRIIMK